MLWASWWGSLETLVPASKPGGGGHPGARVSAAAAPPHPTHPPHPPTPPHTHTHKHTTRPLVQVCLEAADRGGGPQLCHRLCLVSAGLEQPLPPPALPGAPIVCTCTWLAGAGCLCAAVSAVALCRLLAVVHPAAAASCCPCAVQTSLSAHPTSPAQPLTVRPPTLTLHSAPPP